MKFFEESHCSSHKQPYMFYWEFESRFGNITVVSSEHGLVCVLLPGINNGDHIERLRTCYPDDTLVRNDKINRDSINQLHEYCEGNRRSFSLVLELRGTPFQKSVWKAVADVPYGETRSYGDIAKRIGKSTACRAVGAANGANPIPIIIPCHRIVGSDGSLTGFGGGIALKRKLLDLETSALPLFDC